MGKIVKGLVGFVVAAVLFTIAIVLADSEPGLAIAVFIVGLIVAIVL